MPTEPPTQLLTTGEFYRLYPDGRSARDERLELIEGVVYVPTDRDRAHWSCLLRLNTVLSAALAGRALVSVQGELDPEPGSVTLPDISLLPPRDDYYHGLAIEGTDVLLLIEVSRTSLAFDRGVKSRLYARSGVAEYWIADLDRRLLEVRREPRPPGDYAVIRRLGPDDLVSPLAFPDLSFRVATLIG